MSPPPKRKAPPTTNPDHPKKKQWRTPKKPHQHPTIQPGDAGIWATCEMHKEGKCTADLRDLFEAYALTLYGPSTTFTSSTTHVDDANADNNDDNDIAAAIASEVSALKSPVAPNHPPPRFQAVRIDVPCVLFFKTQPPIEPVSFVHAICADAAAGGAQGGGRFVKRLTPMTRMGKASVGGVEEVGRAVLGGVFGAGAPQGRRFAIRPTMRNCSLKREEVIRQVAAIVGPGHVVDLKGYEVLVLVDVYRNLLGMSVVGSDYEDLKRYNLAEIYNPTPKPDVQKGIRKTPGAEEANDEAGQAEPEKEDDAAGTVGLEREKIQSLAPTDDGSAAEDQKDTTISAVDPVNESTLP